MAKSERRTAVSQRLSEFRGSDSALAIACQVSFWLVLGMALPAPSSAQTDYYNTDRNRPIRIEDAYPTERYAFDAHLAPLRLERSAGGVYTWGIDPEIAYGVLPRTQLEVGLPLVYSDAGTSRQFGVSGLDVSLLHNLNVETGGVPAIGIRASLLAPVGSLAPDRAYPSLQGMLTRTFRWARFHVNAAYTFGKAPDASETSTSSPSGAAVESAGSELSRWFAGAAIDRTFPLRSLLLTGEVYAQQPIHTEEDVEWNAGAGLRYQVGPNFALDGGIGKRLTGSDRAWFVTFGVARVFGLRSLMPGH
jgi:hypothetical protein